MDAPVFNCPSQHAPTAKSVRNKGRPARLERFALLSVSSCAKPACFRQCLQPVRLLTLQGYCPISKLHNKKQEHPSSMDTPVFGSPSWTRTNDPAVNSRMLYQLSY